MSNFYVLGQKMLDGVFGYIYSIGVIIKYYIMV